jgi:hypothetical protein
MLLHLFLLATHPCAERQWSDKEPG